MNWFQIYMFTRLESITTMVNPIAIIATIVAVCSYIGWKISKTNYDVMVQQNKEYYADGWKFWIDMWRLFFRISLPASIVSIILFLAVPTQKEMAAIYLVPRVTQSDAAKELEKLPVDVSKLLRLKVEQYINEVVP